MRTWPSAAAVAWPAAARAQQAGAMPRIGLLSVFAESDSQGQALIRELMQGLQELGWVNGRNVRIDFRFGGDDAAHISTLATELIRDEGCCISCCIACNSATMVLASLTQR